MAKTTKKGPVRKMPKTGRCKECGGRMMPAGKGGMKCTKCGNMESY